MAGLTAPIPTSVLLPGTAPAAPANGAGVPGLAAFVDLMIGIPAATPAAARPAGGRQGDAATGKALPDEPKDGDPALAWLMAAPPIIVAPAGPVPTASTPLPDSVSPPTIAVVTPTVATAVENVATIRSVPADCAAGPTIDSVDAAPVSLPAQPPLPSPPPIASTRTLSPAPLIEPAPPVATASVPEAGRASLRAAPTHDISGVAAPAVPGPTVVAPAIVAEPPAVTITMRDLVAARPATPDAASGTAVVATAPRPVAIAGVTPPPMPVIALPADASAAAPARTEPAPLAQNSSSAPQPATRPVAPAAPEPAPRQAAAALPAMFARGMADRAAPDRDDRPAPAASNIGAPAASVSTDVVAPTGATQHQPLDTGRQDWPQRMIDRIETLRDNADAADTSIRLKPEALGRVDVALHTHDDGAISVRFTAEQPATRTLIADAAPQLREAAEARGIRLSGTSVDLAGQGNDQRARPEFDRRQPTVNHLAVTDGDDIEADGGRIA